MSKLDRKARRECEAPNRKGRGSGISRHRHMIFLPIEKQRSEEAENPGTEAKKQKIQEAKGSTKGSVKNVGNDATCSAHPQTQQTVLTPRTKKIKQKQRNRDKRRERGKEAKRQRGKERKRQREKDRRMRQRRGTHRQAASTRPRGRTSGRSGGRRGTAPSRGPMWKGVGVSIMLGFVRSFMIESSVGMGRREDV